MPPGKVMSIDSVKMNPSLVMMRECWISKYLTNSCEEQLEIWLKVSFSAWVIEKDKCSKICLKARLEGETWEVLMGSGEEPQLLLLLGLLPIRPPTHFTNVSNVKRFSVLKKVWKSTRVLLSQFNSHPQLFQSSLLSWMYSNKSRYDAIKALSCSVFLSAYLPAYLPLCKHFLTLLVIPTWFKRLFSIVICGPENL